jgi:hypothetical protein
VRLPKDITLKISAATTMLAVNILRVIIESFPESRNALRFSKVARMHYADGIINN